MTETLKIKPLTKSQIIISIDRLTRFKPTEEKYLRVFSEIITANLIFPKFKKNELITKEYSELVKYIDAIFDFSLKVENENFSDLSINKKILAHEKSLFNFDKNVEKLLNNSINYKAALSLLDENKEYPTNIKWLKSLKDYQSEEKNRANFGLKYPLKKLILVEGITEEILLPKFALKMGIDFNKEGFHIISAGGKNQVVKLFYQYAEILKIPIFVVLDDDAKSNADEIKPKMRKADEIKLLKSGEFEDTLPLNLIKRALNRHFKNYYTFKLDDLRANDRMTKILDELFKTCHCEFKKAEFASLIGENIESKNDVSQEIAGIIQALKN